MAIGRGETVVRVIRERSKTTVVPPGMPKCITSSAPQAYRGASWRIAIIEAYPTPCPQRIHVAAVCHGWFWSPVWWSAASRRPGAPRRGAYSAACRGAVIATRWFRSIGTASPPKRLGIAAKPALGLKRATKFSRRGSLTVISMSPRVAMGAHRRLPLVNIGAGDIKTRAGETRSDPGSPGIRWASRPPKKMAWGHSVSSRFATKVAGRRHVPRGPRRQWVPPEFRVCRGSRLCRASPLRESIRCPVWMVPNCKVRRWMVPAMMRQRTI